MKKTIFIPIVLAFCQIGVLEAALPPLYQAKKEMEAILTSPELGQHFHSGEVLQGITKVANGYLVVTNQSAMFVEVRYAQDKRVGPARFHLIFHDPMPLTSDNSDYLH